MKYFLLSWCSEGFECIEDITEMMPNAFEPKQIMAALKDLPVPKNPLGGQVSAMILRAQTNMHRNYEIYVQSADDVITREDLKVWAESNPQDFADYVRQYHYCQIYSDRVQLDRRVIT